MLYHQQNTNVPQTFHLRGNELCRDDLRFWFRASPLPCFFFDFEVNLLTSTSQPTSYSAGGFAAAAEGTILLAMVLEFDFAMEEISFTAFK